MIKRAQIIGLLLCFIGINETNAQDYTRHNWYFSNNDQALIFGKDIDATPFLDEGKVSLSNVGEKLTATDPTTGELLFYSDGQDIYDASHHVMMNGDNINADPAAIQGMAVSPAPGVGNEGRFYLFSKTSSGQLQRTTIDMTQPGNRGTTDAPPLGIVISAEKLQNTSLTNRGQAMISIGSRDMTQFWLVTQSVGASDIELHRIETDGTLSLESTLTLTASIAAMHFSYHRLTGRIAMIPDATSNVNIQLAVFDETVPSLNFDRPINNSFIPGEVFDGSAGWSNDGTKLFFSRNTTSNGNIFRIDLTDSLASVQPILPTPIHESLSLMLAPDETVYHLYRNASGGDRLLGRINAPDSVLHLLDYEPALFDGQDFGSAYFQQFLPEKNIMPQVAFTFQEPCLNNPTQFFPTITPPEAEPVEYFWDFQGSGQTSGLRAPIVTFEQAGTVQVTLTVNINGIPYSSATQTIDLQENDLQVTLQDTTICPDEVLTLDATPQSQGGGGTGGGGTDTYTYRWSTNETSASIEVSEAGTYWVVVTPSNGCPVYASAEVEVYGDENPTANIWHFGNGAGIDFNERDGLDPPPRSIENPHAMNAPEGTATISDVNGEVIFYTDGQTVYHRQDGIMENGDSIGGDNGSTQSVVIVPFEDDETLYYIFTTQEVYGTNEFQLKYSVVDIKEGDGLGGVTVKNQVLFTKSTEKLAAFEGGGGYWLLAHEYGNNTFRAYPVLTEGIGVPVFSSEGSVHSLNDALSGQAGMKFSNGGDRVAVAFIEGNRSFVEIFSFDQGSGELEFEYQIDLNEGDGAINDLVYDVHFSQGGQKLFATMNNRNGGSAGGRILEYRVDTASNEQSRQASKTDIAAGSGLNANYGAIQTGPDGQTYVAIEIPGNPAGTAFVSSIAASEDTASTSSFNPQAVALIPGTNSRLGLPNFVQNSTTPQEEPSMSVIDTVCVEERVALSATGTSDIDEYLWSILDEDNNVVFSVLAQDTAYTFPQGQEGRFNVSLNIFNRCGYDSTFTEPIEVFDIPDPPAIPTAIALCDGQPSTLTAGPDDPNLSYEWVNSQGIVVSTEATFMVTEQEIYTVTITSIAGCSSEGQVFVGPPFEFSLPPAQTVCQNDTLTLDPNITADNYSWSRINPDGTTSLLTPERTLDVDTSEPGVYTYVVSIEDPIIPNCHVRDTAVITVNPLATATIANVVNTSCNNSNGAVELSLDSAGIFTYQFMDNVGNIIQEDNNFTGPGLISVSNLGAGTYSLSFANNSSGCASLLDNIQVLDTTANFSIINAIPTNAGCDGTTGSITVTLSNNVFPITYVLSNADDLSTNITDTVSSGGAADEFIINNVSPGNYTLDVTSDATGCVGSVIVPPVGQQIAVDNIQISGNLTACDVNPATPLTVSAVNANRYEWTLPDGSSASGTNLTAVQSGTYTIVASDSTGNFCPATETVEVVLTVRPDVEVVMLDDICDGNLTLEAQIHNPQPGVSYIYNWSNGANSASITVDTDNTYTVNVRASDDLTCAGADSMQVNFPEPIEAAISAAPACQDGEPITITTDVTSSNNVSYTWRRNDNLIPGETSSSITTIEEGAYSVTITDVDNSCSIERSLTVRRNAIPEGLLPERTRICEATGTSITLIPGVGFRTYEWTFDGEPYPNADSTFTPQEAGEYIVTMTTPFGCIRQDTVLVQESCEPGVFVPNAFVPEGENNTFYVVPNEYIGDFSIYIYSRWGELIFHSGSENFEWDGTFKGKLVPVGTYPYIIRFNQFY